MLNQEFPYHSNFDNAVNQSSPEKLARGERGRQHRGRSLSPMTDGESYASTRQYSNKNNEQKSASITRYDHPQSYHHPDHQLSSARVQHQQHSKKYGTNINTRSSTSAVKNQRSSRGSTMKDSHNNNDHHQNHHNIHNKKATAPEAAVLDLKQAMYMDINENDAAFQIVARFMLEQLDEAESNPEFSLNVDMSFRHKFIDAVQIRMKHLSRMSLDSSRYEENYVQKLTRFCHDVGLGCDEPYENPLLRDRRMQALENDVDSTRSNDNNDGVNNDNNNDTHESATMFERSDETIERNATNSKPDSKIYKMELIVIQSKARHQIMVEIRESQQILNETTSQKGVDFWKHHMDVLLRRLHDIDRAGDYEEENDDHNSLQSRTPQLRLLLPETKHVPITPTEDIALATPRNGMSVGSGADNLANLHSSTSQTNYNLMPPNDNSNNNNNNNSSSLHHPLDNNDEQQQQEQNTSLNGYILENDDIVNNNSNKKNIETKKKKGLKVITSINTKMASNTSPTACTDNQDVLKVISPADLPGKYNFEVFMDNKRFLVSTPDAGVRKGQMFYSECEEMDEEVIVHIPYRKWRDELSDCFAHGLCHTLLWNSFCLPQITMGQIMTRLQLNWIGQRTNVKTSKQTFATVFLIWLGWLSINIIIVYSVYVSYLLALQAPNILQTVILTMNNVFFILYTIYIVTVTRSYIRKKYDIRASGNLSEDFGDLFLATFCMTLNVAQMGRMTTDYGLYRAVCCSPTGLPEHICIANDTPDVSKPVVTNNKFNNDKEEEVYIV